MLEPVFRIGDILVWIRIHVILVWTRIRIRGSVSLTNNPDPVPDSALFVTDLQGANNK
jgi:hypothetical protein